MMSFPLLLISPHSKLFLTASFSLFYCYLTGFPPSVTQGSKGPPPPSLLTGCVEKRGDGELSSHFYVFPAIPNFFSQHPFPVNCYSVSCSGHPPSVNQGNTGPPPPSLPASCAEKAVTVSFPLVFLTHYSNFFAQHLFQLNCYSVGDQVLLFFIFIPSHSSQFYHVTCSN